MTKWTDLKSQLKTADKPKDDPFVSDGDVFLYDREGDVWKVRVGGKGGKRLPLRPGQITKGGRIWEQIGEDQTWCCTGKIPETVVWDGGKNPYKKTTAPFVWPLEHKKIFETGEWQVVNNYLTFIAPWHYLGLNHWPGQLDTEDGMKEYREKDRKRWMHFYTMYMYPLALGQEYLKRRRDGASMDGGMLAWWFAAREPKSKCGISSYTEDQAVECLTDFVKDPMELIDSNLKFNYTKSSKQILFAPRDSIQGSRNSKVYVKSPKGKGFDGDKLKYLYVDEFLKYDHMDINQFWQTHKQCLTLGPMRIGFSFWSSTVEKMGAHVDNGKKLYEQSKLVGTYPGWIFDPECRIQTTNGLCRLFLGAEQGADGFIDQYGEDVVETPTNEQWAFMQTKYRLRIREGSRAYQEAQRKKFEEVGDYTGLQHYKRQYPWNSRESFDSNNLKSHFNVRTLSKMKEVLEVTPNLWRRGYFKRGMDGRPKWYDDDTHGRFWVSWFPPIPCQELNRKRGVIGVDPFGSANVTDAKRCSMGAGYGKLYLDRDYERRAQKALQMTGKEPAGYYPTNSVFLQYYGRPTDMKIFYEDFLMAAEYFGVPLAVEPNINSMIQYVVGAGKEEYLLKTHEMKGDIDCSNADYLNYGVRVTEDMAVECMELIDAFLLGDGQFLGEFTYAIWTDPRRLPFLELVDDLFSFDNTRRTKHDRTMAFMQVVKAEWGVMGWYEPPQVQVDARGLLEGFGFNDAPMTDNDELLMAVINHSPARR
jgi:hypothetical protein